MHTILNVFYITFSSGECYLKIFFHPEYLRTITVHTDITNKPLTTHINLLLGHSGYQIVKNYFMGGVYLSKDKVYASFLKLFMKNEFTCYFMSAVSFQLLQPKGHGNTQKMSIKIDFSVQFHSH